MSSLLTSLTAVERLSAHANSLPQEFARALGKDLEYARFGAALPELPYFGGPALGLDAWMRNKHMPHFSMLIREQAPVAFGFKAAELVSNGALVGVEAGYAFLAGYFTQLMVARELEPSVQKLMLRVRKNTESEADVRFRIEWSQSLQLMQELHGTQILGTPSIRAKLQLRKSSIPRGIGRGLYELMRVSSLDAFNEAPTKREVDAWIRGLFVVALALASPLGKLGWFTQAADDRSLFREGDIDVFQSLDAALERTREVLTVVGTLIRRNSFTSRAKEKLFAVCPEGPPQAFPARVVVAPSAPMSVEPVTE